MAQFSWTDDLYTGSTLIDGDHRKLVDLVNAFFHDLIAYTGEHFAREEAEMERIQYVAALAHKAEHAKLLKQLVELKEMLDAGGKINVPAVADFVSGDEDKDPGPHYVLIDENPQAVAVMRARLGR